MHSSPRRTLLPMCILKITQAALGCNPQGTKAAEGKRTLALAVHEREGKLLAIRLGKNLDPRSVGDWREEQLRE